MQTDQREYEAFQILHEIVETPEAFHVTENLVKNRLILIRESSLEEDVSDSIIC